MSKPYVVVDHEQGTQEWLDWRSQHITATDSIVLMDRNPYGGTPLSLYRIKKGIETPEDLDRNPNVRRGKEMEPEIRREIEDRLKNWLGDMLLPLCVESTKFQGPKGRYCMVASLDGITDKDEPVEMKAPSSKRWSEIAQQGERSETFQMYRIQVLHQMMVTGAEKGYLIFGSREQKGAEVDLLAFTIHRDPVIEQEIQSCAEMFATALLHDEPPEPDPDKDVFMPQNDVDMRRWITIANRLKRCDLDRGNLQESMDTIKEEITGLKEQLSAIKGSFKTGECHGVRISTVTRKGATDYKTIAEEHAPQDVLSDPKYQKPGSSSSRLTFTGREQAKNVQDDQVQSRLENAVQRESKSYFNW